MSFPFALDFARSRRPLDIGILLRQQLPHRWHDHGGDLLLQERLFVLAVPWLAEMISTLVSSDF